MGSLDVNGFMLRRWWRQRALDLAHQADCVTVETGQVGAGCLVELAESAERAPTARQGWRGRGVLEPSRVA